MEVAAGESHPLIYNHKHTDGYSYQKRTATRLS
jgi:hypothetical protein